MAGTNTFEFSHVVLPRLLSSRKTSRDPRDIRLAAVTSAIVETANERRELQKSTDPEKNSKTVTSSEIFVVTLTALEGTITSTSENHDADGSPQFPLLQILENTIPHLPPSLFASQFNLLSRLLRALTTATKGAGFIADSPADTMNATSDKMETKDELGGQNAKLRQIIKTSKVSLAYFLEKESMINGGDGKDKALLKLLDGTLMVLFHDKRPKVRKLAHASVLELLSSSDEEDEDLENAMDTTTSSSSLRLFRAHIGDYIRAVLSHYNETQTKKSKKKVHDGGDTETLNKMMHLLQFCESVCRFLPSKYTICDDAMQLVVTSMAQAVAAQSTSGMNKLNDISSSHEGRILLVNSLLSVLISVMDDGGENNSSFMSMAPKLSPKKLELAGKTLASLIQLSSVMKAIHSTTNEAIEEYKQRQSQLIVSCSIVLRNSTPGMKLLPIAITMILNNCDSNFAGMTCIQSCSSELQRLIRTCLPKISDDSNIDKLDEQTERKQCALACNESIKKILHHRFRPYWDVVLPSYSLFITELGGGTNVRDIVKPLLRALVESHNNVNDETSTKAIENIVGTIIQGLGVETFWNYVPLDEQAKKDKGNKEVLSNSCIGQQRSWLIPLLLSHSKAASSTIRPRLGFFQTTILGLARKCDGLTGNSNLSALELSVAKTQCVEMWSLLAGFCDNHPTDIVECFPRLAQIFNKAILDKRYPQLIGIISGGLQTLATSAMQRAENSPNDERIKADLETISKMSEKLLPTLFKLVDTLSVSMSTASKSSDAMDIDDRNQQSKSSSTPQETAQKIHHVTMAIQALAQTTPAKFLQTMFQKLLTRLLTASQQDDESDQNMNKISSLLNLAQALVSSASLEPVSITLLYRAIKPLIRTDEYSPNIQKRAYKVMAALCKNYTNFIVGEKLEEVIELMVGSLMTCQVAARSVRLQCLEYVVSGLDCNNRKHMNIIPQMMGELLLCLKDSNTKTRECAYQLLLSMSRLHEKQSGSLQEFFTIILGALGGQTPQMRSAAVMALSRLVFEYARNDLSVQSLLPSLLQTVIVLFDENSREVIKSVIGFVRISVAALAKAQLEPLLPDLLQGLFKYNRGKGRFRSKIKIILKRLVKIYGYEKLSPLVPEARLVNHMRKMDERAKRRKEALKAQGLEAEDDFEDMMDSDEDDSDDGRTLMTGVTGFTKMTAKSGRTLRTAAMEKTVAKSLATKTVKTASSRVSRLGGEGSGGPRIHKEKDGEVFDLLDPRMSKHVHFEDNNDGGNSDFDDDDDNSGVMEFDEKGRLVVQDDMASSKKNQVSFNDDLDLDEDDEIENAEIRRGGKRMKMSKFEDAKMAKAKANADKSRKKQKQDGVKSLGSAYKSKKAGGDVKKKSQKYEPYAYVPLDGKSYSKKNRGKAVNQMATVVKTGKRKHR